MLNENILKLYIQQIIYEEGFRDGEAGYSHNFHKPCREIFSTELEAGVLTAYKGFLKYLISTQAFDLETLNSNGDT